MERQSRQRVRLQGCPRSCTISASMCRSANSVPYLCTIASTSDGLSFCTCNTAPAILPESASPAEAFHWPRSPSGTMTFASMTFSGCTELGLGCKGNISDVPELGGLKADIGRRGNDLGPLRRAPTPGDIGGTGKLVAVAIGEF